MIIFSQIEEAGSCFGETKCFVPAGLQRSLSNTEDECTHLKEMSERGQEELRELANKYNAAVNEIKELTDKIKVPARTLNMCDATLNVTEFYFSAAILDLILKIFNIFLVYPFPSLCPVPLFPNTFSFLMNSFSSPLPPLPLNSDLSSALFAFAGLSSSPPLLLQAAEGRQEELTQRGATEKKELELRIEEMEEKEQVLQARIEALQADNDFTNERLAALQGTRTHTQTCPNITAPCKPFAA